jgi:uncharacterized membrane protein
MKYNITLLLRLFSICLIGAMFIGGFILFPSLPEKIPTHWNMLGEIDGYMHKNIGVWIFPVMTLIIYILFHIIPSLDPNKGKYKLFQEEWQIIQTVFVAFFSYIYAITLYIALYPTQKFMPLSFIGFGIFFILLGNYLSKIRQNFFIGIKVPWTLSNEDNWNKTHRYASWLFVGTGIITLIEAYFIWYAPVIIFGGIMLSAILPIMYSFLLFKKKENMMKYVYGAIFGIILIVFSIRLLSGEDDWICQNGTWVKHGNPSIVQPTGVCK